MQWALLAVIVVSLFLLSGRYPKVAFSVLGVLVFSAAAYLLHSSDQGGFQRKQIPISALYVDNMAVVPAYADSFRVTGRLVNDHAGASLKEATLKIMMLDCASADAEDCQIVGQVNERLTLSIPPGQARDFSTTVHFGFPSISGRTDWQFEITDSRS